MGADGRLGAEVPLYLSKRACLLCLAWRSEQSTHDDSSGDESSFPYYMINEALTKLCCNQLPGNLLNFSFLRSF